MSRYEQYMVRRLKEEEKERAGKEAYGNLDVVNNPAHYNQAGIECKKAQWYLNKLIETQGDKT